MNKNTKFWSICYELENKDLIEFSYYRHMKGDIPRHILDLVLGGYDKYYDKEKQTFNGHTIVIKLCESVEFDDGRLEIISKIIR